MMQDRSAAAATWHYLATVDVNNGRYREAQSKFRMALAIQQEVGDSYGEANTFANLGALAVELGQAEIGLRLFIIGVLLMREIEHPHLHEVEQATYQLAQNLQYDDEDMNSAIEEAVDAYHADQGWSLIEEAFDGAYPARIDAVRIDV